MRDAYFESVRPCGVCIECKLKRASYIATRCVHESMMHDENSFLTLTFDEQHLPVDLSLNTRTMQLFWKKLRRFVEPKLVKHYTSGEYGDGTGSRLINPHYHAILFGYDFSDKKYWKTQNGNRLYISDALNSIWGLGYAVLGDVTFESAAYVARYTLKKVYGDDADQHYQGRLPEKSWSSQGLAKSWFEKYGSDVYPSDEIILRSGRKLVPPPYYDKLLLDYNPKLWEEVQNKRAEKINIQKNNFSLERFFEDGKPVVRTVSDVVRRANLRVGSLDKNR